MTIAYTAESRLVVSAAPEEILAVGTEDEHVVPAPRTWIKLAHLFVGFEVPNADRSDAQCCAVPALARRLWPAAQTLPIRPDGQATTRIIVSLPGRILRVARSSGDLGSRPRASPGETNDAWFPLRRPECQTQSDRVELNPSKRRASARRDRNPYFPVPHLDRRAPDRDRIGGSAASPDRARVDWPKALEPRRTIPCRVARCTDRAVGGQSPRR